MSGEGNLLPEASLQALSKGRNVCRRTTWRAQTTTDGVMVEPAVVSIRDSAESQDGRASVYGDWGTRTMSTSGYQHPSNARGVYTAAKMKLLC